MPMTNAERQRKYRQRALRDPETADPLTRVQVYLGPAGDARLKHLCRTTGKTQREIIEAALELATPLLLDTKMVSLMGEFG